ncbi:MAG: DUF3010 family protein [Ignavibacteria bacterium]|nr:DUF3010 family protein [Ignavibacteria bacterium]
MKTIGIDISGTEAILVALSKDRLGNVSEIQTDVKKIKLNNDQDSSDVIEFRDLIHTYFDGIGPDKIGIIKRNCKGTHSASPLSFKLEGLIQCYGSSQITFVHPLTLKAFYKNEPLPLKSKYNYQLDALQIAYYLLKK